MSRRARDYYPTPRWCLDRLAEEVDLGRLGAPQRASASSSPPISTAWEPAAGQGHLADALTSYLPDSCSLWMSDIHAAPGVHVHDFIREPTPPAFHEVAPDLIITNPPYSHSDAFARRALDVVSDEGAVVLLLRLTWLGGAAEAHPGNWLHEMPPSAFVLPDRPRFTTDGSGDSSPSAWCVWRKGGTPTLLVLRTTSLERRRADEAAVQHPPLACAQGQLFEEAI